jgi:hypothetical protein
MLTHLESAATFENLESQASYRRMLDRHTPARTVAA